MGTPPTEQPGIIQFPETAQVEWEIAAEAVQAAEELRKRLARDTRVEGELERLRVRHEAALAFQQELDAGDTPPLEMLSLASFKANPASTPVDLIDGVLGDGLCIFLGPSGSGKSTLALQACHSLLTGEEWLGRDVTKVAGSVGILSYDMAGEMVLDWMEGYPSIDPNQVSVVNAHKRGNPLAVVQQRAMIANAWRTMQVHTVVVDSFSASFFGHDQNDAAATMSHYRDLRKFALSEVGARVLIVIAHSTKDSPNRARGSTVHHDVADSIVAVQVDERQPTKPRTISMAKYRAARGQHQMADVIITAPDDVTHLVDVDTGAMSIAGFSLPKNIAARFPDLPEPDSEPEPDTESAEGDDDL